MPNKPKMLAFDDEARAFAAKGVTKLARAVKTTLGPAGRNAVIDRGWGEPVITKDGASVADEIDLVHPYENMVVNLVKEAAAKTARESGDGSTTATVLAEAIFRLGTRQIVAGASPMVLARGLRKAVDSAVASLKSMSKPVKTTDQVQGVATVAANHDKEIGKTIAQAFDKVGHDGVISIEEGKGRESVVTHVEGMEFDRGYLSPHFVTNSDDMVCELKNPHILILEEKVSSLQKILPLLEKVLQTKRPLLIVAEDVEGEVLATLVVNTMKGVLNCAAVKAPAYGDRRKAMLEDIAILTGGTAIMKDLGLDWSEIEVKHLGSAKRVEITSEDTTIVQGGGKKSAVEARANEIRRELEGTESEYDREKLEERLAKLVGGVALIEVGAATESDMKERKSRFESARSATRAALEEGILPGGGIALYRAAVALKKLSVDLDDEQVGVDIIQKALEAPIRQLCVNDGVEPASVLRNIRSEKMNIGYDFLAEEFVDMLEAGVTDATKVVRTALQNAASVATVLLTSDALIAEIPQEEDEEDHHHHHHDE